MKRLEIHEPKYMEAYNHHRRALKVVSNRLSEVPKSAIKDLVNYAHESCHILNTLSDNETEYLLQLYGVCFYEENSSEEFIDFFDVSEDEFWDYTYYLLHKLFPEKLKTPKEISREVLVKFNRSCSTLAKFRYI